MNTSTPTQPRTLNVCVTNLREDEFQFLRQVVSVFTDPGMARDRENLRLGVSTIGMVYTGMEITHPFTAPRHIDN